MLRPVISGVSIMLTVFSLARSARGFLGNQIRKNSRAAFTVSLGTSPFVQHSLPEQVNRGMLSESHLCVLKTHASDIGFIEDTDRMTWENDDLDDGEFNDDDDDEENTDADTEDSKNEDDQTNELLDEYHAWSEALSKALKGLQRKEQSLQSELKKAEDVEKTMTRAQLIISNLYLFTSTATKSVTVQDWENDGKEMELTIDSKYDSAQAEADALFAQARKLKRGSQVVGDLVLETQKAMQILKDAVIGLDASISNDEVDQGMLHLIQDRLRRSSRETKFTPPSPAISTSVRQKGNKAKPQRSILDTAVRKLKSPGGCTVWVGRNRRGNEHLSFNVARGDDIWMHARGSPGAHVILQNRRGGPKPTDECLAFCANIAIFYSDARTENKASVTAAEPKHILKPRGAPLGAVKLREELYVLTGYPDRVPEDLKMARDKSGQVDEFRSKDKAKHRKRTKAVAKESLTKRRAEQRQKKRKRRQSASSDPEPFDPF